MSTTPRTDLDAVAREQADLELAKIVRCPTCRGGLAPLASSGARGFECAPCRATFPEGADGILDLVAGSKTGDATTTVPSPGDVTAAADSERVRRRYDREALLYDLTFRVLAPLVFHGDLDRMRALARSAGEARVALDVPAGTGFFLPPPSRETALVVAADLSRSMLRRARARAAPEPGRLPRTRFVRADVCHLPFADGAFGAVSCLNGLHVFPDFKRAAAELARVRAPGGLAVGCSVLRPPFGPRRALARAFVWRSYITTLFDEPTLRALLVESGLVRPEDAVRGGEEIYWSSRQRPTPAS